MTMVNPPPPLRWAVMPGACDRCGGDLVSGRYAPILGVSCRQCMQCGHCNGCCPKRTGAEADAAAADLRAVAQQALRRLANGADVARPDLLAEALGAGIAGEPLAPPLTWQTELALTAAWAEPEPAAPKARTRRQRAAKAPPASAPLL